MSVGIKLEIDLINIRTSRIVIFKSIQADTVNFAVSQGKFAETVRSGTNRRQVKRMVDQFIDR